jgi:arylsulfatase A-like enzyme
MNGPVPYGLKVFCIISFAVVVSCHGTGTGKSSDAVSDLPNILLIMTDDQGWYDAGFNGNTMIRTPNLDDLASRGIILDRFYSASAVCSPTRASVITGRNPLRMGIPTANSGHMPEEEITIPELLKKTGYHTAHFGKWHLGTLTRMGKDANRGGREEHEEHYTIPTMHGYDQFFCTESKVPTYDPMVIPMEFQEGESRRDGWNAVSSSDPVVPYGTAYWKGEETKETCNLDGDDSRVIMDRVIPFISGSVEMGNPFFATVWFHTPHLPVVADSIRRSFYPTLTPAEQRYFGTLSAMDEEIGRLWSHLEDLGIDKRTMIWFCSDNGPENNTPGSAGIFRERKRSLYEGGVRVPAFVVWTERFRGGSRLEFPAVTSDYLPTVMDILGIGFPDQRPMDGESILAALEGKKKERDQGIGFIYRNKVSWVNNHHKLISTDNGLTFELYDLVNDRGETENIIEREPEVARSMKEALLDWRESVEASQAGLDYRPL